MKLSVALVFTAVMIVSGTDVRASEYEDAHSTAMTPLYKACMKGDIGLVNSIIDSGADVNEKNPLPELKYHNAFREESETPLFAAIRAEKPALVNLLLDKGASMKVIAPRSGTPLLLAVETANPGIVRILIDRGADVNAMVETGSFSEIGLMSARKSEVSPLHLLTLAAGDGDKDKIQSRIEIMKMLIAKGADVNAREPIFGRTPLHCAVRSRQIDLVEILVENGADVNARETDEYSDATPLYYALDSGDDAIEKYLRKHGAISKGSRTTENQENYLSRERTAAAVNASLTLGIPLAYLGGSIYLYESRFKHNRGANAMGTFNAYALSTFSFAAAGFLAGCVITPRGDGFLGGLNKLVGGFFGAVIGIPVGVAVAHYAHLPHKAKRNRMLYYGAPAASMAIPLIAFTASF
ncbi:MAG TPA: ankyrin repeat domain-containing protein [Spirochaetota bacterium]|nr:ankyrin repeat domain-containing protein [Spirochaetota bacterium]